MHPESDQKEATGSQILVLLGIQKAPKRRLGGAEFDDSFRNWSFGKQIEELEEAEFDDSFKNWSCGQQKT